MLDLTYPQRESCCRCSKKVSQFANPGESIRRDIYVSSLQLSAALHKVPVDQQQPSMDSGAVWNSQKPFVRRMVVQDAEWTI